MSLCLQENSLLSNSCRFCSDKTQEKRLLMTVLFRKIKKEITNIQKKFGFQILRKDSFGFRQLIRIVFSLEKIKNEPECQHKNHENLFLKKLNCSQEMFHYVCQRVGQALAERNYHLELTSWQVKNVVETVMKGYEKQSREKTKKDMPNDNRARRVRGVDLRTTNRQQIDEPIQLQKNQWRSQGDGFGVSLGFAPIISSQSVIRQSPQLNKNNYGYYITFPLFFSQTQ